MSEGIHETVNCLDEIKKRVHEILHDSTEKLLKTTDKALLTHTFKLFFRGQANSNWAAVASLFRGDKTGAGKELYTEEGKYLKNIYKKVEKEFKTLRGFSKMAKVQHYGGKTRLLDFTEDVEIAAFFACNGELGKDGIIYCCYADYYDFTTYNKANNDIKNILLNYCCKPKEMEADLNKLGEDKKYFNKSKNEIRELISQDHFILLPKSNERIKRQKGLFLWMGDTSRLEDNDSEKALLPKGKANHLRRTAEDFSEPYKSRYNGIISTLNIPNNRKKEILEELKNKYGITSSFIYARPEKVIKRASNDFLSKI